MIIDKLSPIALCLGLAVAGSMVGCKKKGGDSKNPDNKELKDAGNAEVPDEQAKAQFAEAYEAYETAKSDGSLSAAECERVAKTFQEVYESNKRSMLVARFNVGALWEECGDMEKAAKVYQELGDKNFHLALNNLGVIAWNKGDTKKALDLFKKSVDADKKQAFAARNNLAAAHRDRYADKVSQEDFEIAEKQIQNVLAVDTSNKAAYENLARLYYDRGRLKDPSYLVLANLVVTQAIRVLEKDKQDSADIRNLQGLLFMQQDNQIDALKAFKKAVSIDANHADANRNIGFIAIRFRDYPTAEKAFDTALKDASVKRDIEVYIAMGVAKRGLKKFTEAEEWYRKAMEIDKKDPRPWYNLAVLNQDHLVGQDDVDQTKLEAFYKTAQEHCGKFMKMAEGNKKYADAYADCVDRDAIIKDTFETFKVMAELEKKAKELEALEKKQEEERRKRLLEMEQQAAAAGEESPMEAQEAAADAEGGEGGE
ncbi:tetratricopeptide repeat protein [Pseudenhygromyxa sp. WMMC2535]|uniref:tetratricopeptide repeat protein n=1 Tax=Pseudenhygromyxa sp. WMMC2535 TaxID=2712867 RepID=UPI00155726CF|nr:tetratricopeptide repeat protein [Pseudenhygromyxa sp. WMMC2535]NVB37842.1 tetratricopeptide repeat protein [Pseudenhygromyxa sp. WMMC2535]